MLLEMTDLRVEAVGRNRAVILENVNLRIDRGEVLGVIGESGAGKSTVGLAALGYSRPGTQISRGRILFDGVDLRGLPHPSLLHMRASRTGYVAQSAASAFNPAHTLNYQLCEVPVRHGLMSVTEARAHARSLFKRLLLPDPDHFGERYPHQASGGELQRAMAAMALMSKPVLIIMDEPTSALDVTSQATFIRIMRKLIVEDGLAALYISHDLAIISQLSTSIMVLQNGRIEEQGPAEQLIREPRSAYTRALVEARRVSVPPGRQRMDGRQQVLEVRGITKTFHPGNTVLDRMSLALQEGETLAVVGESGSGKTTLARIIAGLVPPSSGEVTIDGHVVGDIMRRSQQVRRDVQLVHQHADLALNPTQSVREIIGRPLEFFFSIRRKERDAKIRGLLLAVGLPPELAGRMPATLSGGQKQRVCIARALAAEPRILICDEVTASLDYLIAHEIVELLRDLKRTRNLACLLITHDFEIVEALADRVAVLRRGLLVEEGFRDQVMTSPKSSYTANLLAAVPRLDVNTAWVPGTTAGV
jgi:peptide/nickel transport system ATP-binding protein